jgi:hypothetical protein
MSLENSAAQVRLMIRPSDGEHFHVSQALLSALLERIGDSHIDCPIPAASGFCHADGMITVHTFCGDDRHARFLMKYCAGDIADICAHGLQML